MSAEGFNPHLQDHSRATFTGKNLEIGISSELLGNDDCGVGAVIQLHHAQTAGAELEAILYDQKHRGGSSTGGVVLNSETGRLECVKDIGPPKKVLADNPLARVPARMGICHNRYTTSKETTPQNAQPFIIELSDGTQFALAHNGNIEGLESFELNGIPPGTSDSARVAKILVEEYEKSEDKDWSQVCRKILPRFGGSFNLVMTAPDIYEKDIDGKSSYVTFAAADPRGNRPLWWGRSEDDNTIMFASESNTLEKRGMSFYPVNPGEMITVRSDGQMEFYNYMTGEAGGQPRELDLETEAFCIFEVIYGENRESRLNFPPYEKIGTVRQRLGRELARHDSLFRPDSPKYLFGEGGINKDDVIVTDVPKGGTDYAIGFAEELGFQLDSIFEDPEGVLKELAKIDQQVANGNGRSYMEPDQASRIALAMKKLKIKDEYRNKLLGKTIVLVDDSIIKGNVQMAAIRRINECIQEQIITEGIPPGQEPKTTIIAASGSPVVKNQCDLGMVMDNEDLLYKRARGDFKEMANMIGADHIRFQSKDGLLRGIFGKKVFERLMHQRAQQLGLLGIARLPTIEPLGPHALGHCLDCIVDEPAHPSEWYRVFRREDVIPLAVT